jgi:hypothetical protein
MRSATLMSQNCIDGHRSPIPLTTYWEAWVKDRGWTFALIAPARDMNGCSTQVVTGLINTKGGLQIAMRIREEGEAVILPLHAANEVVDNLLKLADEWLKRQGRVR